MTDIYIIEKFQKYSENQYYSWWASWCVFGTD